MQQIASGIYHWVTVHEGIRSRVSSYYLSGPEGAFLVDPRVPKEGLQPIRELEAPTNIYLTNRHHYRHSGQFEEAFGCTVWCHREGLHEFRRGEAVRPFEFGDRLPGGVEAVEVNSICPEETAIYVPWARAVAMADSLVRSRFERDLAFVADAIMVDDLEDAPKVKAGLFAAFRRLLELDFDHLLLAHGLPFVGDGKQALRRFVEDMEP